MSTYYRVTAIRDYTMPCSDERCETQGNPEHWDCYPDTWSEWMDPTNMLNMSGWNTEPTADEGEPVELIMPRWTLRDFVEQWHGEVWNDNEPALAGLDYTRNGYGSWSIDDYGTERESIDRLFIERISQ